DIKSLLSQTKRDFEDLQAQLFNDFKQLAGNIRVYYRIRPTFNAKAKDVIDFIGEDGSLVIVDPSKRDERKVFWFNNVYGPTATQDEVFKDTRPFIRSVMDGYNVCILAYGQTGSGKTYTICDPSSGLAKDMGINCFTLNDLFQLSNQRKDIISYDIYAQMVEIYNEQVRDLLAEESSSTKYPLSWLEIRSHHTNDGLSLLDAALHFLKSTVDVLNLMKHGDENRVVNFTAMNNQSSRSYSVLTVHVHGNDTSGNILHSRLYLVDLAGTLSQKSSYIPCRNSKLTLLLLDALGGHAKTLMFAHVSPEGDDFGEILGTLKFARRVSGIELGAACLNKHSSEVRELKQQEGRVVSTSNADFRNSKSLVGSGDPAKVMLVGQAIEISTVKPPKSPEPHLIRRNYRQTALHYEVSKDHQMPSRAKSPPSSTQQQPRSLAGYATKIPTIKSPKSPVQQCFGRNVQIALGTDTFRDCQAPIIVKSAWGKGSQIMKSL
ncbi:hypothetical protein Ancab_031111, partial [Ancistrocladus abbreviatus]